MRFSKVHIPPEPVPGGGGIGGTAGLRHMDADRGEMDSIEDLIYLGRPLRIADRRRRPFDIDICQVGTVAERIFHNMDATGHDDRLQPGIALESMEGHFVHLVLEAIVGNRGGHLHRGLAVVGRPHGCKSPTPRLKDHIGILEAGYHLKLRARRHHLVVSHKTGTDEQYRHQRQRHDPQHPPAPPQHLRDLRHPPDTFVDGLDSLADDTMPLPP